MKNAVTCACLRAMGSHCMADTTTADHEHTPMSTVNILVASRERGAFLLNVTCVSNALISRLLVQLMGARP